MTYVPSGDTDHPPSLIRSVFAVRMKKSWVLGIIHWVHSEYIDQTGWIFIIPPGWSESLLGAQVILLVLSCAGSFYFVKAFRLVCKWNKYVFILLLKLLPSLDLVTYESQPSSFATNESFFIKVPTKHVSIRETNILLVMSPTEGEGDIFFLVLILLASALALAQRQHRRDTSLFARYLLN